MKIELEDLKNGWHEIFIGLKRNDIDKIIDMLTLLKKDNEQHFHISNKYEEESGVCDIEIYFQDEDEDSNMIILGPAIPPND